MATYSSRPLNFKVLQIVLKAAQDLNSETFTAGEVVKKVHQTMPNIPETNIKSYMLAMSKNHSPTHHQCFDFLGDGKYKLSKTASLIPPQHQTFIPTQTITKPTQTPTPPNLPQPTLIHQPYYQPTTTPKEQFQEKYTDTIITWTQQNKQNLIEGRKNYHYQHPTTTQSIETRNQLQKQITQSRIQNNGGIDLQTLDQIMAWGFPNPQFPERDPQKCIQTTKEAFTLLDQNKPDQAITKLMTLKAVGIARATKILGLSDPQNLAIFDSKIGNALKTLTHNNQKIIKCPPGPNIPGDHNQTPTDWAENYQKLIWTLQIIKNELNQQGYPFNTADVEMALYTIEQNTHQQTNTPSHHSAN